MFSCEFCEISKNTFSHRTSLVAVGVKCIKFFALEPNFAQKMKFSFKEFFSKCDQSHIFCAEQVMLKFDENKTPLMLQVSVLFVKLWFTSNATNLSNWIK